MRIRVKDVLDMLAEGATPEPILADYADPAEADTRACLAYAARYVDHAVVTATCPDPYDHACPDILSVILFSIPRAPRPRISPSPPRFRQQLRTD